MTKTLEFDETSSLRYLGLPPDHSPSPKHDPIAFLLEQIHLLPPHILAHYSLVTTPKQRTIIPLVRNRRLKWTSTHPPELDFVNAQNAWPGLWEGQLKPGVREAKEERAWAETQFLAGATKQVGKLGNLLAEYEEERQNINVRGLRRVQEADDFIPEEDEDTDEEEEEDDDDDDVTPPGPPSSSEEETEQDLRERFERRVQERFIYGLLEGVDYDKVDWDESLDEDDDRDAEERWFDEEDED